jgi:hypothetical protein
MKTSMSIGRVTTMTHVRRQRAHQRDRGPLEHKHRAGLGVVKTPSLRAARARARLRS